MYNVGDLDHSQDQQDAVANEGAGFLDLPVDLVAGVQASSTTAVT